MSPRVTAIAVLLVLAPALAAQDTLRVRQVLPAGELRPASVITVTFNRPLAGTLERLRDPATVVRLVPMIAARFEWRDPATIRVIPVEPLPPGSSLSITIDTLTSADGVRLTTPWSHAFTVRSPAVVRSSPHLGVNQRPMLDPSGRILLRVSGEIDTMEFARTTRLVASSPNGCRALDGGQALAVRVTSRLPSEEDRTTLGRWDGSEATRDARFDRIVELTPLVHPPEGCFLDLVLPLTGAGTSAETRYAVRSVSPFRASVRCVNEADCTAGRALALEFPTPVTFSEVRQHVRFAPEGRVALPDSGAASPRWVLPMEVTPGDTLRVSFDRRLQDTFGRPIATVGTLSVVVGDRRPGWSTTSGLLTLAATAEPAVPIRHVNVDWIRVTLFRSPSAPASVVRNPSGVLADSAVTWGDSVHYVVALETPRNVERLTQVPIRLPDATWRQSLLAVRIEAPVPRQRPEGELRLVGDFRPRKDVGIVIQFTDLMAHVRAGAAGAGIFVTDVRSGAPVPDAQVILYDDGPRVIARARTDANGIASLAVVPGRGSVASRIPERAEEFTGSQRSWPLRPATAVEVVRGAERSWTPVADDYVSFGRLRSGGEFWWGPSRRRAEVFSDRDIYRPGEMLYFTAIVRDGWLGELAPPAGERVRWRVRRAESDMQSAPVLMEREATLSPFGVHADSLLLPSGARLGGYVVQLERRHGDRWRDEGLAYLRVAEYRAPEFLVSGAFASPRGIRGDTMHASFTARLLLDAPLPGAPVVWGATFTELRPWDVTIPGLGTGWQVGRSTNWWAPDRRAATLHRGGVGRTEADGTVRIDLSTDSLPSTRGATLRLGVSITDVSGQAVTASASTVVAGASFHLVTRGEGSRWWWKVGEPRVVRIGAITGTGSWVNGVTIHARALLRRWESHDALGMPRPRLVTDTVRLDPLLTQDSSAHVVVVPRSDGAMEVEFVAVDSVGREVMASTSRWVIGNRAATWGIADPQALLIASSADSLRSGDTLSVSFSSPFERAQGWVTVEREGMLHQERIVASRGENTLRLRVDDRWMPSVTVGVLLVPDGDPTTTDSMPERYRLGSKVVAVDHSPKRLRVTVRPVLPEYRPGTAATIDVRVTDARGRPVRGEVILWATDEGVMSLTGFETPDPIARLYGRTGSGLRFSTTLTSLARELARLRGEVPEALQLRQGFAVGGVAATREMSLNSPDSVSDFSGRGAEAPRSDFRPTAFYRAGIRTDAAGRARVLVKLPDDVTTFRLMAIAVDRGDRAGSGEGTLVASKTLLVRAAMPRFVRPMDQFTAGGVVNTRGRADTIPVGIAVAGEGALATSGAAQRTVTAGPEGALARFNWVASRGADARVTLAVTADGLQDAVTIAIPVRPDQSAQAHTIVALVRDSATLRFVLPSDVDPVRSSLTMRMGPTPLPVIRSWVAHLEAYPYDCTEQLASAGRAMIALLQLERSAMMRLADAAALRARLDDVLASLLQRQRSDGSFGYWSVTSWSLPWLDAYVGAVLLDARDLGLFVPADVFGRLQWSLERHLKDAPLLPDTTYGTNAEHRAVVARHLSQRLAATDYLSRMDAGDSLLDPLTAEMRRMNFEDRARLALVLARRPERVPAARALLATLWDQVTLAGNRVDFPDSTLTTFGFPSRIRPAAFLLRATQLAEPRHPLIGPLAQRIIQRERAEQGTWWNTQDYAQAADAIAGFMRGEAAGQTAFELRGALDQVLLSGTAGTEAVERTIDLSSLMLPAGDSVALPVRVVARSAPVYVTLTVQTLRRERPVEPEARGLIVERWYERVSDGETVTEVEEGELVRVRLRVTARGDREFVAVEDPLPAGLEVVDTQFRTASIDAYLSPDALESDRRRTGEAQGDGTRAPLWWGWNWNPWEQVERYDDRVVFHARTLSAGSHLFSYVARATTPGRYVRPQAHAVEMYNPALGGQSDGGWFVVRAR